MDRFNYWADHNVLHQEIRRFDYLEEGEWTNQTGASGLAHCTTALPSNKACEKFLRLSTKLVNSMRN